MTSSFGLSPTALGMCDSHILCDKNSKIDNSLRACITNTDRSKKHLLNILPSHLVEFSLVELKDFIGRMLFMLRMDNIIAIQDKNPAKNLIEELKTIQASINSLEEVYSTLVVQPQDKASNGMKDVDYDNIKTDISKLISFLNKEFTVGTNDSSKKDYSNSYFYNNHILAREEGLISTLDIRTAIEDENIIGTLFNTIEITKPIKELDKVTLLLKWTLNFVSNVKDTTKDETDKVIDTYKVLTDKLQSILKFIQLLCNTDKIQDKSNKATLLQIPVQIQAIIDKLNFIKSKYKTCNSKLISKHNLKNALDICTELNTITTNIKTSLDNIVNKIAKILTSNDQSSLNTISMLDTTFKQLNSILTQFDIENPNIKFSYTGAWHFNETQYAILCSALTNLLKSYYYLTVKSVEYNSTNITGLNSIETILLGRDLKSRSNLLSDMRDKTIYDMNIALNCPHTLQVKKSYLDSITKVIKIYTQKLHLLNSLHSNDKEDIGLSRGSCDPLEELQIAVFAYTQFKAKLKEEDLAIFLRYGLIEINDITINEIDNLNMTAKSALYYKTTDNVLKSSSIEKSIQTALNSLRETYKIIEGQIFYYKYCIDNGISPRDLAKQLLNAE